jgi:hypothetical protein
MLLRLSDLPPDAEPATIHYGVGKKLTVYKIRPLSQGPEVRKGLEGRRYLIYMYNFFVFLWYEDEGTVHIFHGHLGRQHNSLLPWTFTIEGPWHRSALAQRGRQWAVSHVARFTKKPQQKSKS